MIISYVCDTVNEFDRAYVAGYSKIVFQFDKTYLL